MATDSETAQAHRRHELEAAAALLLLERRARRLLATAVAVLTAHVIDLGGKGPEVQQAVRESARRSAVGIRQSARERARKAWGKVTGLSPGPDTVHVAGLDALQAARAGQGLAQQFGREYMNADGDTDVALDAMGWRLDRTATTETVDAWNDEIVRQNDLVTDPNVLVVETWSALLDRRVCPECKALDGTQVVRPERFPDPPPLHPLCRCMLSTEVQILYATGREVA